MFGAPATIARAAIIQPVAAASSTNGDIAVLLRLDETRTVLLTAARGGPFGPPQEIDAEVEFVALGVGGSGRVVLACFDRHGRFALHSGQAGSARGAAQRLGEPHLGEHLAVAIDARRASSVAPWSSRGRAPAHPPSRLESASDRRRRELLRHVERGRPADHHRLLTRPRAGPHDQPRSAGTAARPSVYQPHTDS